jgi:hypothetical protein
MQRCGASRPLARANCSTRSPTSLRHPPPPTRSQQPFQQNPPDGFLASRCTWSVDARHSHRHACLGRASHGASWLREPTHFKCACGRLTKHAASKRGQQPTRPAIPRGQCNCCACSQERRRASQRGFQCTDVRAAVPRLRPKAVALSLWLGNSKKGVDGQSINKILSNFGVEKQRSSIVKVSS